MTNILGAFEVVAMFLAGLAARAGFVLALVILLTIPVLLIAAMMRGADELKKRSLGLREVAGLVFRPDAWYSAGHTWMTRLAGGSLRVGLDALALRLMPSVNAIDLKPAGTRVAKGSPIATIHAGARALTVRSPVEGVVVAVNAAALREPALVKSDGYGRGWLVTVAPADLEFARLPHGSAAETFLREEAARWNHFIEGRLGYAAADGGELTAPAPWLLGDEGWRELADQFVGR
jgi:glycine cleavage system H lipoate-binding protein